MRRRRDIRRSGCKKKAKRLARVRTGPFTKFGDWLERYRPIFSIIELVLLAMALFLGIISLWGSSKFATNVESHLAHQDTLFNRIGNRIEDLPKSVEEFDSTIDKLSEVIEEQQKELRSSIGALRKNVDLFSSSLVSYETMLSEIIVASDKQLELLRTTQASWEEELSRKPDLRLLPYTVERIADGKVHVVLELVNVGNQATGTAGIILKVPKEYNFESSGWKVYDSTKSLQSWSVVYNQFIGYSSDPKKAIKIKLENLDFTLELPESFESRSIILEYIVYHVVSQDGKLKIELPGP